MFRQTIKQLFKALASDTAEQPDSPNKGRSEAVSWCSLFLPALCALFLLFWQPVNAQAQGVVYRQVDINASGGSFTAPDAATYRLVGGGTGFSGTEDGISYLYTPSSGNVELVSMVYWQAKPDSNYATAGLTIRSSLDSDAQQATISISQGNGCNFSFRTADGVTTSVVLGPSITATIGPPSSTDKVFLRLVKSGQQFAGYYSRDRQNWILVGSTTQVLLFPQTFFAGFSVSSAGVATATANFTSISYMINVPQRSSNMLLWLRSDAGLVYDGSNNISKWADQGPYANHATQTTGGSKPTFNATFTNYPSSPLPAVQFSGTNFLNLPPGFSTFSGASIFAVIQPQGIVTPPARILELGKSGAVDDLMLAQAAVGAGAGATTNSLWVFAGGSGSAVTSNNGVYAQPQLVEAVHNGTTTATIYTNGVQGGTGSVNNITNTTRNNNAIGRYAPGGWGFIGYIQELVVLNRAVTTSERQEIESYFYSKYRVGPVQTVSTPVISPGNTVVSDTSNVRVSISSDVGAAIYFTTDGSTPDPSSPNASTQLYQGPFFITPPKTIKAVAVRPYFNSASATAIIEVSPTATFTRDGLQLWVRSDVGVDTPVGSTVTKWTDLSGNGKDATGTSNQPTRVTSAINGLPAISFSGSQYLSMPSGFADFTQGVTCFIVASPTTVAAQQEIFTVGNGASNNEIGYGLLPTNSSAIFDVFSGGTDSRVTATSGFTTGSFQVFEAVHNGNANASMYKAGTYQTQGAMFNAPNVTRSVNAIGRDGNGGLNFNGQIAEILLFNRELSPSERLAVESYISNRYFNSLIITPQTGVYSSAKTVTMAAGTGDSIKYTTDGSDPLTSGTAVTYTAPFSVSTSTVLKAVKNNAAPVLSSYVCIDRNSSAVTQKGLWLWLRSDFGLNFSSAPNWIDISGGRNDANWAAGTSYATLVPDALNGYPGVSNEVPVPPGIPGYFTLPTGFNSFKGITILGVVAPIAFGGGNGINVVTLANSGTSNDKITFHNGTTTTTATFQIYNGASSSTLSAASSVVDRKYQLFTGLQNAASNGTIYMNTVSKATGTLNNPNSILRNSNSVGGNGGVLVEVLLFNRGLSNSELANAHAFLLQKYQLAKTTAAPPAPIISVPTSSPAEPIQVSISARTGSTIYFTLDGSDPISSGTRAVFTGKPIDITYTQTLKATSRDNGSYSSVSTATYTLNATNYPPPDSTSTVPTINLDLPTNAQ